MLDEPEVWGVESLGASSIALRLVVKTQPSEQWRIMRQLREELKTAFDAEGIEIPVPPQTIRLRPDDEAARAAASEASSAGRASSGGSTASSGRSHSAAEGEAQRRDTGDSARGDPGDGAD